MMISSLIFVLLLKQVFSIDQPNFALSALDAHNKARRAHGVDDLTLNYDLNRIAQSYAQRLAATRSALAPSFNRYRGIQLGENLAISYGNPSFSGIYNSFKY
jgi:uncharacterized protein YkwD